VHGLHHIDELETFNHYDLVIATGHVISYLKQVGINVDLYVPYGGDIDDAYANPAYLQHRFSRDKVAKFMLAHYDAAYTAGIVWNNFNRSLKALGLPYYKADLPSLYLPTLRKVEPKARLADFVICNPSRQMWASAGDLSLADFNRYGGYKRNDIFIRGYIKFRQQNPGVNCKFILFNYGADVGATIKLFCDAGWSEDLIVYEKTSRIQLFGIMQSCDVIGDTFFEGWDNLGFQETSMLACAAGTALITLTNNAAYASSSHFNTNDSDEIANILGYLQRNRGDLPIRAKLGRNWCEDYYIRASRNLTSVVNSLGILKVNGLRASQNLEVLPTNFKLSVYEGVSAQDVARRYMDSLGP
jgi:hypothetical protein